MGDEEGAAESYAKVCQMDPQVHRRYLNIAREDYEAGKFAEALRTLQAVEKISPHDFRVFWQRANCRMEIEEPDWEGALADLTRCVELDPVREIEVYIKKGRCSMRLEDFNAARNDAEYYLSLLESQEGESGAGSNAAFEGRLLRAHLYMLEVRKSAMRTGNQEIAKAIKRAVMDYDYVVNTYKPDVNTVRRIYPEAHYCIARLLPHAPDFGESSELAAEATERFHKAWLEGVHEPLQHCVEMVVAEKRLKDIQDAEARTAPTEDGEPLGVGLPSLRSLCATELTKMGKYGGKSMPPNFHVAICEMLAKGPVPEGGTPVTHDEWIRCARHMTLAWKTGGQLNKHIGLATYSINMGRRKLDKDGNATSDDTSSYPSLVGQCVEAVASNEESFPTTLSWMEQLREAVPGAGGGKKKK